MTVSLRPRHLERYAEIARLLLEYGLSDVVILDRIAANELEVKVDAIDEATLMAGFQKVANRITLGLLLAAPIVGASLLMQVPTSFQLLGYPGLAIVLFLLAAAGGIALALAILLGDR